MSRNSKSYPLILCDAQNGIYFSLICNEIYLHENHQVDSAIVTIAKWNSAEAQFFIECLNTGKIASFLSKIKCA